MGAISPWWRQDEGDNTLERIDAANGQGQIVLPHTHADIGWPVFWGSYVLFDSPHGGIDNIHAVHLPSGAQYQVTSRPLAATHAAVAGDSLLFQEYTVDGYRIAVMSSGPGDLDADRAGRRPPGGATTNRWWTRSRAAPCWRTSRGRSIR